MGHCWAEVEEGIQICTGLEVPLVGQLIHDQFQVMDVSCNEKILKLDNILHPQELEFLSNKHIKSQIKD